jgi:RimJ/RimL family protein N-acetyltransferase
MRLCLRLLDQPALNELARDPTHLGDLLVVEGALPPDFILAGAREALSEGRSALWHSSFVFIDEAAGEVVGSGGFKGEPQAGAVEIGYGVAPTRRGRGWASKAVAALADLALRERGIVDVCAETATDNLPSQHVLLNSGFIAVGERQSDEDGKLILWRLR